MIDWKVIENGWCSIRWKVKQNGDRLKLIADFENTGTIPIEDLNIRLRFNASVLRRMDLDRMKLGHLLPGDTVRFTTRLEARREFDETELILRVRSDVGDDPRNLDISLGSYSLKIIQRMRTR